MKDSVQERRYAVWRLFYPWLLLVGLLATETAIGLLPSHVAQTVAYQMAPLINAAATLVPKIDVLSRISPDQNIGRLYFSFTVVLFPIKAFAFVLLYKGLALNGEFFKYFLGFEAKDALSMKEVGLITFVLALSAQQIWFVFFLIPEFSVGDHLTKWIRLQLGGYWGIKDGGIRMVMSWGQDTTLAAFFGACVCVVTKYLGKKARLFKEKS